MGLPYIVWVIMFYGGYHILWGLSFFNEGYHILWRLLWLIYKAYMYIIPISMTSVQFFTLNIAASNYRYLAFSLQSHWGNTYESMLYVSLFVFSPVYKKKIMAFAQLYFCLCATNMLWNPFIHSRFMLFILLLLRIQMCVFFCIYTKFSCRDVISYIAYYTSSYRPNKKKKPLFPSALPQVYIFLYI